MIVSDSKKKNESYVEVNIIKLTCSLTCRVVCTLMIGSPSDHVNLYTSQYNTVCVD